MYYVKELDKSKEGTVMTDGKFNKVLLDLEIMGLISVSWVTKDNRRIEAVWLDAVINQSQNYEIVVCDDVRFINEAKNLKDAGWMLVKLDIHDDLQKARLIKTYGDDWEVHWKNRTDPSEAEVDKVPLEWFDLVITAADDTTPMAVNDIMAHIKEA